MTDPNAKLSSKKQQSTQKRGANLSAFFVSKAGADFDDEYNANDDFVVVSVKKHATPRSQTTLPSETAPVQ